MTEGGMQSDIVAQRHNHLLFKIYSYSSGYCKQLCWHLDGHHQCLGQHNGVGRKCSTSHLLTIIAFFSRFVAPLIVGEIISGNNDFKHWQVTWQRARSIKCIGEIGCVLDICRRLYPGSRNLYSPWLRRGTKLEQNKCHA